MQDYVSRKIGAGPCGLGGETAVEGADLAVVHTYDDVGVLIG